MTKRLNGRGTRKGSEYYDDGASYRWSHSILRCACSVVVLFALA